MILIIDADPMVYRSGFAAQQTVQHVVAEDAGGRLTERYFRGTEQGAQIAQWLTQYKLTELSKDKIVEPEPVNHALFLVKQEIDGIRSAVKSKLGRITEEVILLSGPGNFRCALAKQRPYKGNRDPEHKPYHYQAIRDYITEKGGTVIHGREADDEASILAWRARRARRKYVVATIDKDLDQIPGQHFDYRQKVFYDVDEATARRWFWTQTIAGDATDNIPGCPRMGPAKARDFLDALGTDDELAIWKAIVELYESKGLSEEVALETARLVYMQQNAGELWSKPGVPMGTMETGIDD